MMLWHALKHPTFASTPPTADPRDHPPKPIGGSALLAVVTRELRSHAPFTMLGTLSGIAIMAAFVWAQVPREVSVSLFWGLHPLHVFLSALVTTAMYTLRGGRGLPSTIAVGYVGSVGIATLSDCVIPLGWRSPDGSAQSGHSFGVH